jgi:glycosyltransferase involved in cell wall biosynthesis
VLWPTLYGAGLVPIPAPCDDLSDGEPAYRDGSGLHVGFMGRLVEEKGIGYLISAFEALGDPKARLLIAGDDATLMGGGVAARVREAAAGNPAIRLLGMLSGRQKNDFYNSIDVFALPSIAESFGIAQAEAMIAGVPSVCTDIPGGRYPVAATGFGRIVEARDVPALTAAIRELGALDREQRTAGATLARRMFGIERFLDAYEELFNRVARAGRTVGSPQMATAAQTLSPTLADLGAE